MAKSIASRLLNRSFINDDGCWIWLKGTNSEGYAYIKVDGRSKGAHRCSYEEFVGKIPEGLHVLHKCDVRNRINPDHLFVGTNQDNIDDREAKGRGVLPSERFSKLTEGQVMEIKELLKSDETHRAIAEKFGVSRPLISLINAGARRSRLWKQA